MEKAKHTKSISTWRHNSKAWSTFTSLYIRTKFENQQKLISYYLTKFSIKLKSIYPTCTTKYVRLTTVWSTPFHIYHSRHCRCSYFVLYQSNFGCCITTQRRRQKKRLDFICLIQKSFVFIRANTLKRQVDRLRVFMMNLYGENPVVYTSFASLRLLYVDMCKKVFRIIFKVLHTIYASLYAFYNLIEQLPHLHSQVYFDFHHHLAAICNWKCSFIHPHSSSIQNLTLQIHIAHTEYSLSSVRWLPAHTKIYLFFFSQHIVWITFRFLLYILTLWHRKTQKTYAKPISRHTSRR